MTVPPELIIPEAELTYFKLIGEGAEGRVWLAKWKHTDVAVKEPINLLDIRGLDRRASMASSQRGLISTSSLDLPVRGETGGGLLVVQIAGSVWCRVLRRDCCVSTSYGTPILGHSSAPASLIWHVAACCAGALGCCEPTAAQQHMRSCCGMPHFAPCQQHSYPLPYA